MKIETPDARMKRHQPVWLILRMGAGLLLSIALAVAAQPPKPPPPVPAQPLSQQQRFGDVHVSLNADPQPIGLTDPLRVTLSVEAAAGTRVVFPPVAEKLGPFTVLRQHTAGPVTTDPQRQQWTREYVLEADQAGDLTLPSLTVSFQSPDTSPDHAPHQLSTDPLSITVTSVLPDDADVTAPKDIAPPVALARRGLPIWQWIVAAGLVALIPLACLWFWYRRRGPRLAPSLPPQPAHTLALEALERLQRDDLITSRRIETYYVRLSNILRRYIEWRFGLRAPEQTTEEFLNLALETGGLIATHGDLLGAFLQHCDLVKFARHQPTADAMQQALQSARRFVEQTADDQVLVGVSSWEGEVP